MTWIIASPKNADGRGVLVTLTPAGHALIEHTVDDLLHHEETLLSALTPGERSQLADLLRTLLAGLNPTS